MNYQIDLYGDDLRFAEETHFIRVLETRNNFPEQRIVTTINLTFLMRVFECLNGLGSRVE